MSIAQGPDFSLGLAWLDLSTGEFYLGVSSIENLEEDLSRVNPAEVGGKYFAYNCPKIHTQLSGLHVYTFQQGPHSQFIRSRLYVLILCFTTVLL